MKSKSYYYLLFLTFIYPLIPKSFNNIFNLPIRLILLSIFIIIGIYEIINKDVKTRKFNKWYILVYSLFIISTFLSIFVTLNKIKTIYTIIKFIIYGLLFSLLYIIKFEKEDYKYIFKVFILSVFLIMVYGILNYIFNFNLNYNGISKYGCIGRVRSTMTNPIYFGIFSVFIFILVSYLLIEFKNLKLKYNLILNSLLIITYINIALTFTRSTYLLFIGSFFLIIIINYKKKLYVLKKYVFLILTIILTITLFSSIRVALKSAIIETIPTSILEKTNIKNNSMVENVEITNNEVEYESDIDYSIVTRNQFKQISKKVIKDNLLLGVGFGAYEDYLKVEENHNKYIKDRFGYPHDNYLHILAETGIITFVLFIYVIIEIMLLILSHYFNHNLNRINLYALIIFINVFLISFYESFFYDSLITPIFISIIALIISYTRINSKDIEENL